MNHIHIPRSRSFHRFLFIIPLFLLSDSALSQNTDPFEVKFENTTKAESEKVDSSLELKNWISKELLITLNQKFPATIDGIDQKYLKIFELSGNNEPRVAIWKISSSDQPKNDRFYLIAQENPVNKNAQYEYKVDNFRVSPNALFMLYQTLQQIDISTMSSAPHKPDQIATIRWVFAFSYGDHMRLIHRVAPLSNSAIELAEKDKIVNELLIRTVGQVILSIADGCE